MPPPPGPVKISHKKDGHQRQPHRFHASRPPPLYPTARSATDYVICAELYPIYVSQELSNQDKSVGSVSD